MYLCWCNVFISISVLLYLLSFIKQGLSGGQGRARAERQAVNTLCQVSVWITERWVWIKGSGCGRVDVLCCLIWCVISNPHNYSLASTISYAFSRIVDYTHWTCPTLPINIVTPHKCPHSIHLPDRALLPTLLAWPWSRLTRSCSRMSSEGWPP